MDLKFATMLHKPKEFLDLDIEGNKELKGLSMKDVAYDLQHLISALRHNAWREKRLKI